LLGARIKELRKGLGFLRTSFRKNWVDPKHLSRIELGKSFPYMETLEAIAHALGVELKDLFDFSHLNPADTNRQEVAELLAETGDVQFSQIYRVVKALLK